MPKFVIERDIPGAGSLTPAQLREASRKSCDVVDGLAPGLQWIHSYVTADRLYCIYLAREVTSIEEHARRSGFPASRISRVTAVIDPASAD